MNLSVNTLSKNWLFMSRLTNFFSTIDLIPFMTRLAGGLCLTLGLVAILGWYTDNYLFYQIRPNLTPMYFNTAFNFVLLGLGLMTLVTKYHKWAALLGIASIAFSGIILLQFIVNVDFGIDTFFLKTDVSLNTSAPGRMSPNSSICFIACGFGLILLSFKQVPKLMYYLTLVLGIGVLVLASTSLLGYAADLSATYEWARLTPMALHTAIGFIIASGGIIAFVYSKDSLEEINLSSKSPYLAAVFVCCLTSLLWRASLQQGIERLNDLVSLKSGKIKELVTQIIDERVSDMEELKLHLDESPEISERLWVRSVDFYRNKSPFFKTIEWVDPYYNVQGFAPLKGNENILKRELLNHPFLQKDLEIAKSEGSVRISNVFQLKSGERALYIALPIFKGKMFRGYIIASTDVDVMLREVLNKGSRLGTIDILQMRL